MFLYCATALPYSLIDLLFSVQIITDKLVFITLHKSLQMNFVIRDFQKILFNFSLYYTSVIVQGLKSVLVLSLKKKWTLTLSDRRDTLMEMSQNNH